MQTRFYNVYFFPTEGIPNDTSYDCRTTFMHAPAGRCFYNPYYRMWVFAPVNEEAVYSAQTLAEIAEFLGKLEASQNAIEKGTAA